MPGGARGCVEWKIDLGSTHSKVDSTSRNRTGEANPATRSRLVPVCHWISGCSSLALSIALSNPLSRAVSMVLQMRIVACLIPIHGIQFRIHCIQQDFPFCIVIIYFLTHMHCVQKGYLTRSNFRNTLQLASRRHRML